MANHRGLVITKERERFTQAAMLGMLERIDRHGFVGCKLTLMCYFEHPRRVYREVPGQSIRMRVFNIKALGELLKQIDEVAEGAEIND